MNRTDHLLACLAEECAEVAQRAAKALRFGLSEVQPGQGLTNADRIAQEMMDLLAVANLLLAVGLLLHYVPDRAEIAAKRAKIEKLFEISRAQSRLEE